MYLARNNVRNVMFVLFLSLFASGFLDKSAYENWVLFFLRNICDLTVVVVRTLRNVLCSDWITCTLKRICRYFCWMDWILGDIGGFCITC